MNNNYRKYFGIIIGIMTVCNILDIISTYYVSPTLEYEGNKWVRLLSLNFNGLIIVLIIMQVLNTIPLWFLCFKYNEPKYQFRNSNSFFQVLKIYFKNYPRETATWKKIKNGLSGILAYSGFAFPLIYIFSKIIVTIENFAFGFFLRKITIDSKSGDNLNISYDTTDQFWNSLPGKSLLFYMNCSVKQKLAIQNSILTGISIFLLLFYIWQNYLKAIRTPMTEISDNTNSNEVSTWVLLVALAVSIFILT